MRRVYFLQKYFWESGKICKKRLEGGRRSVADQKKIPASPELSFDAGTF